MNMKIGEIRSVIETANWNRMDATGGTTEENRRTRLPVVLLPHLEKLKALQIPARFVRDIENRDSAIKAIHAALARWEANQNVIPFVSA